MASSDLLLREGLHDVLLKVRHQEITWRMPAHSLLLSARSRALREMLDEREDRPAHLTLVGLEPETVVDVLRYIYQDECPPEATADLLIAAQRYELNGLRQQLEERVASDVGLSQACDMLEKLCQRQPLESACPARSACFALLESHALAVFGSDLVLRLGKMALTELLQSDRLNVPDEAYVFWGVWRWGRMNSSKHGRSLRDQDVQAYIDDLIVLNRLCSLRCRDGIPSVALARFDKCKGRRSLYACPQDILDHCQTLRPCPTFEDIVSAKSTEGGTVCLQISVEKDVLLVGMTLEMCSVERVKAFVRVIREGDGAELRRNEICWCETPLRRVSFRGEPEQRMEAEVILRQPLFLTPKNLYSVRLSGDFSGHSLVWGSIGRARVRTGNTFVNFHGDGVTALRDIFLIPDMSVTWGPRGPSV